MNIIKEFFKNLKVHHYIVFAIVLAIGIFNGVTGITPTIKQSQRESNIERTFKKWWEEERAAQFSAVGLEANEKIRNEEFEQYREQYNRQNHTYIIEDRVVEMRKDFREWWEIGGGREQYVEDHKIYPNEEIFEHECHKWIKHYTDKFLRYRLAYVPSEGEYERLLTSWILFPSVPTFLIFAFFFGFAYMKLSERWGLIVTLAIFAGITFCSGFIVDFWTSTSFFDHYAGQRYMGASISLAFLLGATTFGLNNRPVPNTVRTIAAIGIMLDVLVNWFLNPGIFGAVALTSLIFFGLGILGGLKIPHRMRSESERQAAALEERLRKTASANPVAERKAKTRALIDQGLSDAHNTHYESAKINLVQALNALMQERPIDTELLIKLSKQMTNPVMYIDVSSAEWLEWGETAKAKNVPEAALLLLEKGLTTEKNETLARRALFSIGEIRVNKQMNVEEGIARLKKVLQLNDKDILAMQAKKLIEKNEVAKD